MGWTLIGHVTYVYTIYPNKLLDKVVIIHRKNFARHQSLKIFKTQDIPGALFVDLKTIVK